MEKIKINKKIAFFVTTVEAGGIERYLLRFLTYYQNEIDATVYCKSEKYGVLKNDYLALGVKLKPFRIGKLNLNRLKKLKEEFKKENYDVVVDFTGNFSGIPLYAANQAGVPNRIAFYRRSTNAFKEDFLRLKYDNWLNRLVYKNATHILGNSNTGLDFFFGDKWKQDDRFEVIYNGLDSQLFLNEAESLRKELGIPDDAFVVGHTGRFNKAKNHQTIIDVARALVKNHQDIYFILCGSGVRESLSPNLTAKESKKILLFENRRDIPKFLRTMDCYFFPSITEGQPNALIEAMISNLPIVASNIDPIKEITPQIMHPYLISPFDSQKAKEQILAIRSDSDFKYKMIHTDWAIKQFEANKQFGKFFKKL